MNLICNAYDERSYLWTTADSSEQNPIYPTIMNRLEAGAAKINFPFSNFCIILVK